MKSPGTTMATRAEPCFRSPYGTRDTPVTSMNAGQMRARLWELRTVFMRRMTTPPRVSTMPGMIHRSDRRRGQAR